MTPQRILKDVKEVIPEDAIIFTDVGWNKNGVAQEFDITVPGTIHHSSGLATMGFGASAVLGGKLAAPDKIVLTLTGDGGFGINPPAWLPPWSTASPAPGCHEQCRLRHHRRPGERQLQDQVRHRVL